MSKTLSTTILHKPRKKLGLSLDEYCLADLIWKLQSNPRAPVSGWCSAKKETLGQMLDISKESVKRYLKHFTQIGLIEKKFRGQHIRTTEIWYDEVIMYRERINQNQIVGRSKRPTTEGQTDPPNNMEGSKRPAQSVKLTHTEGQTDPSQSVKLTLPYIDKEYKIRSTDKGERYNNPLPNLQENKNVKINNPKVPNRITAPPVAPPPPSAENQKNQTWLDCQQTLLDFFSSEVGQGQKQMMCEQVGFDEARHGTFENVLKVFSEKNQDNYQFLAAPVAAFAKRGYNWLRTQMKITKIDQHGNSRTTSVDNREPQPNRTELLERYFARQNNRGQLGEGTAESEPVRNHYGLSRVGTPTGGNHRYGLDRPLVFSKSQHEGRTPYGRS